jgi:Cdc6-like AAA superfamily ATPase
MSILKSHVPFSDDFLPPQLVDREIELATIERYLDPLKAGNRNPSSLFVTGGVGVGKTTIARFILASIPKTIPSIHITVTPNTTTYTLASQIARSLFPDMNLKRSTDELLDETVKRTVTATLLVLDEIDRMPLEEADPILHFFSRFGKISIIIISRKTDALSKLPEDTKSSLKCRELLLHPYNEEQLMGILRQRAELGLQPNVIDDEALEEIAKYASYLGNARLAIDILYEAASLAESAKVSKISLSIVKSAIAICERRATIEALRTLPITYELALKAIIKESELQPATYRRTYIKWLALLQNHGLPEFSFWKFLDVIAELKKLEFVTTQKHGKGRAMGVETILEVPKHIKDVIKEVEKYEG